MEKRERVMKILNIGQLMRVNTVIITNIPVNQQQLYKKENVPEVWLENLFKSDYKLLLYVEYMNMTLTSLK